MVNLEGLSTENRNNKTKDLDFIRLTNPIDVID